MFIPIAVPYFLKPVVIAPNAPTTSTILITLFIPHLFVISALSNFYFSIFPTSLSFICISPSMATSTVLTLFLVLSITAIPRPQASILISHWITKPHNLIFFILNNSLWIMFLRLWCSFTFILFT